MLCCAIWAHASLVQAQDIQINDSFNTDRKNLSFINFEDGFVGSGSTKSIELNSLQNEPVNVSGTLPSGVYSAVSLGSNVGGTLNIRDLSTPSNQYSLFIAAALNYSGGATTNNTLTVDGNNLQLADSMTAFFGGATAEGISSGNVVNINSLYSKSRAYVVGGYSAKNGNVSDNQVYFAGNNKVYYALGGFAPKDNSADLTGNVLQINKGSLDAYYISGAMTEGSGNVMDNTVSNGNGANIDKGINLWGGYAKNGGIATGNTVALSNGTHDIRFVSGGEGASADSNKIYLKNGTFTITNLHGGHANKDSGHANENLVSISNSSGRIESINGGWGPGEGKHADNNLVNIDSESLSMYVVIGGFAENASSNTVSIKKATVEETVYGGHYNGNNINPSSQINNNIVELDGVTVGFDVYGGRGKGILNGNRVLITDSNVGRDVYGAFADSGAQISGNLVSIEGNSHVKGDVYGAYSNVGPGDNNSVALSGNVIVSGGVYATNVINNNAGTTNTLVFTGHIQAGKIGGFTDLHLLADSSNQLVNGNEYILTVTNENSLDLRGKNIDVYDLNNTISLPTNNEKYGLIRITNAQGGNSSSIKLGGDIVLHNTFTDKTWKVINDNAGALYIQGDKLVIQPPEPSQPEKPSNPGDSGNPNNPSNPGDSGNPDNPSNPGDSGSPNNPSNPGDSGNLNNPSNPGDSGNPNNPSKPNPTDKPSNPDDSIVITPSVSVNVNSYSLSQNRLASVAAANQAATFAAEAGIEAMKDQLYGKNWFFVTEGGANKYEHGFNKIDLNGASMITGLMNNVSGTLVGGFFEASWGHASSKENLFSAKSNLQSYGVGLLASREYDSNFEVDGSFRIGWLRNSFKGRYFDVNGASNFKTNMLYVSGHIGAAYHYPVSESTVVSPYARYIVSYIGSDKVSAGDGGHDKYKAKATVSHTIRAGVKVKTQLTENFKLVGGLAVDETMGAKAKGSISGYDLKTLSINGTSGFGELKLQASPSKASPWKAEIGVKGYVGARRGILGQASVNYRF